jgi:hypothetical protein
VRGRPAEPADRLGHVAVAALALAATVLVPAALALAVGALVPPVAWLTVVAWAFVCVAAWYWARLMACIVAWTRTGGWSWRTTSWMRHRGWVR